MRLESDFKTNDYSSSLSICKKLSQEADFPFHLNDFCRIPTEVKVPVHIVHSNHVILCNLGVKDLNICFNVFGIGRLGDNSWGKKMSKFYQGKQIYQWECKCRVWSVYKTKTYMYMMYSVKHSFCKKLHYHIYKTIPWEPEVF